MGTVVEIPMDKIFQQIIIIVFLPLMLGYATQLLIIRKYGRCLTALKRYQEAESALLEAHAILLEEAGAEHLPVDRRRVDLRELPPVILREGKGDVEALELF